jgi:hypothetical protein
MWRCGDEVAGAEVGVDRDGVMLLRLWGTLTPSIVKDYSVEFERVYKTFKGRRWGVVCNLADYPIQPVEISTMVREVMRRAKEGGHVAGATLVSSTLTKMQIRRIAQASGIPEVSFFQDKEAAKAWLDSMGLVYRQDAT